MTTPLFQEALIEAKKLREAAANEAKNAVLEAVSPLIKQMIDKEISGVILEQEEPPAMDAPPPPPAAPSPDAGATGPVSPAPAGGEEPPPPPLPTMAPATAIGGGAPPIVPAGTPVETKIEADPTTGEPKIVIDVSSIFSPQVPSAPAATQELAPPPAPTAEMPPPGSEPDQAIKSEEPAPPALEEIYRAVHKLLAEQGTPAAPDPAAAPPAPPPAPVAPAAPPGAPGVPANPAVPPTPPVDPGMPPVDPTAAAAGTVPPPAPAGAPPPATPGAVSVDSMVNPAPGTAQPPTVPAPMPPAVTPDVSQPPASPPPIAPQPNAAGVVKEYKEFKTKLEQLEESISALGKRDANRSALVRQSKEKATFSLYETLVGLKNKNAISSRLFASNEGRLDLLHENLNLIYSYTQNPLTKGKKMKTKNSLTDFARSLFEGAEGFEKEVGHVEPAGDSEGGSSEDAHKRSGNPNKEKAAAEKAPFHTKQKNVAWEKASASSESLLEQLEEEIAEMMGSMEEEESMHEQAEEEGSEMEEAVFEMDEEEVMMEARKARARLRKLREQAEEEAVEEDGEGDDHLSLTIDLDGVSGDEVENVNVSLDGENLDVDMDHEEGMEPEEGMDHEEDMGSEEEEEEGMMNESRRRASSSKKQKGSSVVNENKVLRNQLAETQLLTARSLYVNKLFVRDDLSSGQKRKIVEYLDSARTLAEAKEIYNRVTRVLNTAKKNGLVTESTTRSAQVLTEAAGIVEPSFDTSRWQILAGVKRNAK